MLLTYIVCNLSNQITTVPPTPSACIRAFYPPEYIHSIGRKVCIRRYTYFIGPSDFDRTGLETNIVVVGEAYQERAIYYYVCTS